MKHSAFNGMRPFAAMASIVLAFARFAHAGSIGTDHSQKAEKVKKGTLKIAVASTIGALRLGPGEYEVKQGEFCRRTDCQVHTLCLEPLRTRGVICA